MWLNGCSRKLCPMQVGCTDNCRLTKEQCPYFTQDVDFQKLLNQIKAEVAREIFEEINSLVGEYEMGDIEYPDFRFRLGKLEKKHTEGNDENI